MIGTSVSYDLFSTETGTAIWMILG